MVQKGGILGQVIKARELKASFLYVLLHGLSGTGKSTTCGTAPGKLLYLWAEQQGVFSLKQSNPDADTIQITTMKQLGDIFRELRIPGHGYESVAIDSLTEVQRILIDEIVSLTPGKDAPDLTDWRLIIERSVALVRVLRTLPMNVVVTCLSDEQVVGENQRMVRPALSGKKLPAQLSQFFNIVGYCFKKPLQKRIIYRVLIDGRDDFTCKGLPGLRFQEDPDIAYWYRRIYEGETARDPEAPMISGPNREGEKSNA